MTSTTAGKGSQMATTFSRICVRRDTAENWHDPSIAKMPFEGEICLTLEGDDKNYVQEWGQIKIGDGIKEWADLEYYAGGGADVIVSKHDPSKSWPGGGEVPEGTLWFQTGGPDTLFIWYNKDWQKISEENQVYVALSGVPPNSPIPGDLWYQTDTGFMKIWDAIANGQTGGWVPACVTPNMPGSPDDMVQISGGDMIGALTVRDDSALGAERVFEATTFRNSNGESNKAGGLKVTNDGKVSVLGESTQISEVNQLTTKDYVDKKIVASIDGSYLSTETNDDQEIHSLLYLRSQKTALLKDRSATQESEIRNDRIKSPNISIGNASAKDKWNTDMPPGGSYYSTIKKLQCTNSDDLEETPHFETLIYDRATEVNYISTKIRAGSNGDNGAVGKPTNYPQNLIYDKIQWNNNAIPDPKLTEGTPQRFINWLIDPEDDLWDKDFHSTDKSPAELRAANKGYVDRVVLEKSVGKGSDLCAENEDNAQTGGFWRDNTSGIIYLKVS